MGFRFRRRIKIAPGIYINVGKGGVTSATIGKHGASLNIGKSGVKTTVGAPGTGLSYTSSNLFSGKKSAEKTTGEQMPPAALILTNREYRKLSSEDKKAFKNAGGKVKLSTAEKLFLFASIIIALASLPDLHPTEKGKAGVTQEAKVPSNN